MFEKHPTSQSAGSGRNGGYENRVVSSTLQPALIKAIATALISRNIGPPIGGICARKLVRPLKPALRVEGIKIDSRRGIPSPSAITSAKLQRGLLVAIGNVQGRVGAGRLPSRAC